MAQRIDDRWLWLGIGVTAFLALKGIQHCLADLVHQTKLDPYQYEPIKKDEERPEDGMPPPFTAQRPNTYTLILALTLPELKVLADSPHPNISNSAISLILSRISRHPKAGELIVKDLASKNPETSHRAREAIHYVRNTECSSFEDRQGLPISPDGYSSPLHWSDAESEAPDDDGLDRDGEGDVSPLGALRDELLGSRDVVPSIENPVAGWENVPRERGLRTQADGSVAESRRRRREAMVLHEGAGAVTGDDIFRPR